MARFFIDRPVFAWVIAIVIMLVGGLSITRLPISQFPPIAPPAIQINATYPGASAETLENTVTQVIEQQMKGIDNLRYMSSTSESAGTVTITLTFEQGTDPDIAQVQVQNKLQLATPLLPQEVQQQGMRVTKSTINFLAVLAVYSEDGKYDSGDLGDIISSRLQDPLSRVTGVGDTIVLGAQYAMRIWIDPYKLQTFGLTPADVKAAIRAQNAQVSAGQVGARPSGPEQQLNATVNAQSRLRTPEQFRQILLRTNTDGSTVRIADVARVEIGSESYEVDAKYNGHPAAGFAIRLASGANALDTINALKARVDELSSTFPPGVKVAFAYDSTPFVRVSIHHVVQTLFEAVVLVFLVMLLFLQNFRATLIPTIAVPVVLLGTFGVLAAMGYSINTLTLFGMVLAIGLLVDDAIVVVENVERIMAEEGLPPLEATRKSMEEISGALIGIGLVLSAVFIPMAFFGGSTGIIFRQFSVTIVSAMALSVLVALVLTPALCSTILKPIPKGSHGKTTGFFGWFNRTFDRGAARYENGVSRAIRSPKRSLLLYGLIIIGLTALFARLPTGFLPDEDQGTVMALVQLPAGASVSRTIQVNEKIADFLQKNERHNVASVFTVNGFSLAGRGQNIGMAFVGMTPWDERAGKENSASAVAGRLNAAIAKERDATVFAFIPPAIIELGNATGFDFELQDRNGLGHKALLDARNQLLGMAAKNPDLIAVRPNGQEDAPQLQIDVDQAAAGAHGLSQADVNDAISTAWGGAYVNDFIDRGRVKKVYVQADEPFRKAPDDLDRWNVRGISGEMTPLSTIASTHWMYGSSRLERYNGLPAFEILGEPAPGKSSGTAMKAMEEMAAKLPAGVGFEWTGLSYEERLAGNQAMAVYALSLLMVFLCLAALYESWSVPFAVMTAAPLGVFGAVLSATLGGLNNDVYFQVALLTTVGVSAKNAILIVEFAEAERRNGSTAIEAALYAARLRLRPILMTSFAFIGGIIPLALSKGAGAGGQNAIGIVVAGGMAAATVLAIMFVPLFFVLVSRITRGKDKPNDAPQTALPEPAE
ncbi:efflux RND transporter permease subunit [Sphingobium sp. H39-3-25]|uniref:efflux RND transporter permease subunit n=1 Tax=Sphingomonadales TaxID=204457 RepID=UPI00082AB8DF|nr:MULTISPECIES: efflux RND transporter permease subunit [Sphingomonadaceae]MDF0488872.1 efflux RND transporter permease subunit [Sphingomonas pollutisoli]MDF0546079.1 efflux RND transporter permease subunit [Sphingobium arseniciresistens]